MTRKTLLALALLAIALVALAGTALAASYRSGSYVGTTAQTKPDTGKKFAIKFKISKGKISNVLTYTRDACPDGRHLQITQNAFKSAKLDRNRRFVLRAGTARQPAVLRGRVTNSQASGTLTDKTANGTTLCTASTTWKAKRKK